MPFPAPAARVQTSSCALINKGILANPLEHSVSCNHCRASPETILDCTAGEYPCHQALRG